MLEQLNQLEIKARKFEMVISRRTDQLAQINEQKQDPRFEDDWNFTLPLIKREIYLEGAIKVRQTSLLAIQSQIDQLQAGPISKARDFQIEKQIKEATLEGFRQQHQSGQLSEEAFIRLQAEAESSLEQLNQRPNQDRYLRKGLVIMGILEEKPEEVVETPPPIEIRPPVIQTPDEKEPVINPDPLVPIETQLGLRVEGSNFIVTFSGGREVSTLNEELAKYLELVSLAGGKEVTGGEICKRLGFQYGRGMQHRVDGLTREATSLLNRQNIRLIHFIAEGRSDSPEKHRYHTEDLVHDEESQMKANSSSTPDLTPALPKPKAFKNDSNPDITSTLNGNTDFTPTRLDNQVPEIREFIDENLEIVLSRMDGNNRIPWYSVLMVFYDLIDSKLMQDCKRDELIIPRKDVQTKQTYLYPVDIVAMLAKKNGLIPEPDDRRHRIHLIKDLRDTIKQQQRS